MSDIPQELQRRGYFARQGHQQPFPGLDRYLVAPGLDPGRPSIPCLMDVTAKKQASWYATDRVYNHGIETTRMDFYRIAIRKTGLPIYLVVFERSTGAVLAENLERLDIRLGKMHQSSRVVDMAYFLRDQFRLLFYLRPHGERLQEIGKHAPVVPSRQQGLLFGGGAA